MSQPLMHLALRDAHTAAGAQFEVRDGWSLPVHYGDPRGEHAAIRTSAAVLDRSHRSRVLVSGTDAADVLAAALAGNPRAIEEGRGLRTAVLDDAGVVRDLVLAVRSGAIAYMLLGEPGQRLETIARLQAAIGKGFDARVDDRTPATCTLAITGPEAEATIRAHVSDALPAALEPLQCVAFEFHGFRSLAVRASDTGEDGFEMILAPAVAQHLIATLRAGGVPLAGEQAHDVARIEACVPAFAPDLETGLTLSEAGLDVLLGLPGGEAQRELCAILLEGPAPTGTLISAAGTPVGEVRSCVAAFSLDGHIGLAVIDRNRALPGTELSVAGQRATVVTKPFYRRRREG